MYKEKLPPEDGEPNIGKRKQKVPYKTTKGKGQNTRSEPPLQGAQPASDHIRGPMFLEFFAKMSNS